MTVELKPDQERMIQEQLASGHFQNIGDLLTQALRALGEKSQGGQTAEAPAPVRRRTAAEAVAHIRQSRKGNNLPAGVTIKGLINEGRA